MKLPSRNPQLREARPSNTQHRPIDIVDVAILVAFAALTFSIFVFVYNHMARRRSLLLQVIDQWIEPDRQRGRRVIYEMHENDREPTELTDDELAAANHALSHAAFIGFLYDKRYISRKDVLDVIGVTVARIYKAAERFVAHRNQQHGEEAWPTLRSMAQEALARYPNASPGGEPWNPNLRPDL